MALQRREGELDEGNYCLNKNCFDSARLNLLVQIRLPATLVVRVGPLSSEYWVLVYFTLQVDSLRPFPKSICPE